MGWLGLFGWFGEKAKRHPQKRENNLCTTRPALLVKMLEANLWTNEKFAYKQTGPAKNCEPDPANQSLMKEIN